MLDLITTDNQYTFDVIKWKVISKNAKFLELSEDFYKPNDAVLAIYKSKSGTSWKLVNVVPADELQHALEASNIMNRNIA